MANKELLETIRKEIISRIDKRHLSAQAKNELISLLHFLSTLESEKPINPEDAMKELDEKIALVKQRGTWDGVDVDKYMDEVRGREPEKPAPNDLEEAAKEYTDGKSWAKENYLTPYIREAFIAGAKWDRSQMMKEAVEGTIDYVYDEKGDAYKAIRLDWLVGDFGDKVRIIIVKED